MTQGKGQSFSYLLGVSLQHLNAEAELRKFFGSRVVQATRTKISSSSRRNVGALKSNLTRPQPNWWTASQREGLSIRPLTLEECQEKFQRRSWDAINEKWWTVEYSRKYKSMTKAFIKTVLSGGERLARSIIKVITENFGPRPTGILRSFTETPVAGGYPTSTFGGLSTSRRCVGTLLCQRVIAQLSKNMHKPLIS